MIVECVFVMIHHNLQGIEANLDLVSKHYPGWLVRVYYDLKPGRFFMIIFFNIANIFWIIKVVVAISWISSESETMKSLCQLACNQPSLDICHVSKTINIVINITIIIVIVTIIVFIVIIIIIRKENELEIEGAFYPIKWRHLQSVCYELEVLPCPRSSGAQFDDDDDDDDVFADLNSLIRNERQNH